VEKLKTNKQMAFFSKKLATIHLKVPIKITLKELDWQKKYDIDKIKALFNELNFQTLIRRLPGFTDPPIGEAGVAEDKQQNLL
jgi:5'-3' exonuclease